MQAPTPEQIRQVQYYMGQADPDGLLAFLQQNPTVDVNNIRRSQSGNTLYMEVMFDARISVDSPLFIEVLRRNPDPFLKNNSGNTALDLVRGRYHQFQNQRFLDKYRVAKQLEEDSVLKSQARNLSALMLSGKNALGQLPNSSSSSSSNTTTSSSSSTTATTSSNSSSSATPPRRIPLPQNAQNLVTEFLTGIKGPTATKMSQLRVKAGLPGVSSGTQGGSHRYKKHKNTARKSKKTKKNRRQRK